MSRANLWQICHKKLLAIGTSAVAYQMKTPLKVLTKRSTEKLRI